MPDALSFGDVSSTSTFEYFPKLPTELRLKIWQIALALPKYPLITFSLSGPKQCHGHNGDRARRPWRHISSESRLSHPPPLLHVCHESRCLALPLSLRLKHGLRISHSWRPRWGRDAQIECPHQTQVACVNKELFWDPQKSVIMLQEVAVESPLCPKETYPLPMCQSTNDKYQFIFDDRIRFLAMKEEMWNVWRKTTATMFNGLDVLFILVDKVEWEDDGRSTSSYDPEDEDETSGAEWERRKREFDVVWTRDLLRSHGSLGVMANSRRLAVKLVDTIDEIFEEVKLLNSHSPALP